MESLIYKYFNKAGAYGVLPLSLDDVLKRERCKIFDGIDTIVSERLNSVNDKISFLNVMKIREEL